MSAHDPYARVLTPRSWAIAVFASAAVAGLVSVGFGTSSSAATAVCDDLQQTRAAVHRLQTDGSVAILADLEGETARLWIDAFNTFPPQTAFAGDAMIAVVSDATGGDVMVAIFERGCEFSVGAIPAFLYVAIDEAMESSAPEA